MPPAKPQATAVAVGKKLARPRHRGSAGVGRQLSGPAGRLAHAGDASPSAAPATPSGDGVIASPSGGGNAPLDVPVVSWSGRLLMPWHPARARELVRRGRAVRRFSAGVFYIQLPTGPTMGSSPSPARSIPAPRGRPTLSSPPRLPTSASVPTP